MLAHTRSLSLVLAASLLTSCAVGPRYNAPEIPLSAQFLGQEGVERRAVHSKADLHRWWAGFDDPALTRFVALALAQNRSSRKQRHVSPNRAPHCA
jgi:outer membrane protein TolC